MASPKRPPRVAIVIYTMHGHIAKLAEAVKSGIAKAEGSAEIYQVQETLSEEVLKKMNVEDRPKYPVFTAANVRNYDAFVFGIPTRFGNMPAQWKAFWDTTGKLWTEGQFHGKYASIFVSTSSPGGGQEMTPLTMMSTLVHHGMIFVPLGYRYTFPQLGNLKEAHGGSPWGAGTLAAVEGDRQPSPLELEIATIQGERFWETISLVDFEKKEAMELEEQKKQKLELEKQKQKQKQKESKE